MAVSLDVGGLWKLVRLKFLAQFKLKRIVACSAVRAVKNMTMFNSQNSGEQHNDQPIVKNITMFSQQ